MKISNCEEFFARFDKIAQENEVPAHKTDPREAIRVIRERENQV